MTRALPRANWIGPPSLCQLWLETLLRVAAMLWSNVAATFRTCLAVAERRRRMLASRLAGDWHTDAAPRGLPGKTHDTLEESKPAAERSEIQKPSYGAARRHARPLEAELGPRFPRRRESSPPEKERARSAPNPFGAPGFPPQFTLARRTGRETRCERQR